MAVLVVLTLCLTAVAGAVPVSAATGSDAPVTAVDGQRSVTVVGAVDDSESADTPSLALTQRTLGNVFLANETVRIGVETDAATVAYAVYDSHGERVANGTATVDGERTLDLPVESVGHYTLRVRTTGSPPALARTTLAVLPADGFDNDDMFFGMSTQFDAGWDHELMGVMDVAGVATVREDTGWSRIERTRGEYDFSVIDDYMTDLRARGFDRLAILAYGNPLWDPEDRETFTLPDTPAYRRAFGNFSAATASQYDDIEYVEVWNEPNLDTYASSTDPAAYADLLAATDRAVDGERPVTVVGGSATANYTNTGVHPLDKPWWRGLLEAGGAEHMDAMSIHLYRQEPTGFREDLRWLRSLTREHNDGEALPVWVTELGWYTSPTLPGGDSEATQARHLVQSHTRLLAAGVERFYWYTLQDSVWNAESSPQTDAGSDQFGLVRRHDNPRGAHTPKPALLAYATMTRQLAGGEFRGHETGPVERHVFANASGGERVRVLRADESTDVTVHADGPVTLTTMTGTETRLSPRHGEVYLTVGPDPLYLAGNVSNVTAGVPVSVSAPVTSDAPRQLSVGVADGFGSQRGNGSRTVTHRIGGETATVTADAGTNGTATLPVPSSYRGRPATVVDVVSVDGRPVGRLTTPVGAPTARLGAPATVEGMTVETRNDSAGGYTEINDVGTRYSEFDVRARDGRACWQSDFLAGAPGNALYIDVPDDHLRNAPRPLALTVTYFDGDGGRIAVEYDAAGDEAGRSESISPGGSGRWRNHTFTLTDARLADGLSSGHDLQLSFDLAAADVCVGALTFGTEPADPLPAPPSLPTGTPTADTPSPPPSPSGTGSPSDTDTPPDSAPSNRTTGAAGGTSESGPGFEALGALVGVTIAALARRRTKTG